MLAEFREANFVEIFSSPYMISDSVSDADSRDIKLRSPYMRGRINLKVRLITIFNCPVILGYF